MIKTNQNYKHISNEKNIAISKVIKMQNMLNEYFLGVITSLESDCPLPSNKIDLDVINQCYKYTLDIYQDYLFNIDFENKKHKGDY